MAQAYNPFAFLGRLGKYNPNSVKGVNEFGSKVGLNQANTGMGYLNAGQKALKGDIGGALTTGADTYLGAAIPAYGALKTFNQLTGGGINFNRMMNPRKPVYDEADLARKAMMTGEIESQRNLASEQIRGATERRQAIRPMQDKVQSDILDMLTQGLSSRQLAPIYGAGEARNRQIGAASQAAMQQQLASRGVSGGVQAGVEQANLASQNERSAALNNAITQQQIQQRPEMLNMASNLLAQRDAQALSEMQYGQGLNLQASQMANQQALQERQLRMQEDAASRARRQQEMESVGQLMALLSPELQRLKTRGKKPGTSDFMPTDTPTSEQIASEILADEKAQYDALLNNAPVVGRSGNFFQDLRDASELERSIGEGSAPLGDAFNVQNVLRGTFGLAQPENVAGEMMRVTDVGTIDEIEASRAKRIMKDVGNGLAIMAYKDQATGQYFKQYVRSNPALLGESISGNPVLTKSEQRQQRGVSPLGFASAFYG
jgi:hypothetical protein